MSGIARKCSGFRSDDLFRVAVACSSCIPKERCKRFHQRLVQFGMAYACDDLCGVMDAEAFDGCGGQRTAARIAVEYAGDESENRHAERKRARAVAENSAQPARPRH